MNEQAIKEAASALEQGGIVAFPTETVYGLGADAANAEAIRRLYALKGRPADHPSIVHLATINDLDKWARHIPEQAIDLGRRFWPGPLTMIFERQDGVLDQVTGGQDSVAIRIPGHPIARRLIEVFGRGIVGPSANKFGCISPTTAEHVKRDFGSEVSHILDGGPCIVGVESTIVDFTQGHPVILRPGMLTSDILSDYLREPVFIGSGVRAPGTLKRHYSPRTPSHYLPREALREFCRNAPSKLAVMSHKSAPPEAEPHTFIGLPNNPKEYAQKLYAWLRYADAMHPAAIVIEELPDTPQWEAVRDRVRRATAR